MCARCVLRLLLSLTAVCALPASVRASVVVYRTDAELVAQADRVVYGRVAAVRSELANDSRRIYTFTTIEIIEDLTGFPERTIEIRELGGRVGDVGFYVGGAATYDPGQFVLVCLSEVTGGYWRSVAMSFSKFDVVSTSAGEPLLARHSDITVFGAPPGDINAPRSLAAFRALAGEIKGTQSFRPPAAQAIQPGEPIAQHFDFLGPARWHEADSGTGIDWYRNTNANSPAGTSGAAEIQTALAAWTNPSTASITLQYRGDRTSAFECGLNGAGVVTFGDPMNALMPGVLAEGGGCVGDVTRVVNGQSFANFTAGFVTFNNDADVVAAYKTSLAVARILEHELGHAIGLGHTQTNGSVANPTANIMYPSCCSSNTPVPPAIGPDDLAGLEFIYPQAPCTFTLSASSATVSGAAGSGTVSVTTQSGCAWTAASNAAWLSVTGGASGTDSGAVTYTVTENTTSTRTGTLTIGGQTLTVTQTGAVDADGDGLPDYWETQFGLNPNSQAGIDGAAGDPDGDGQNNLAEFQAGTHPRGAAALTRYFAEGATSAFFNATIALVNPSGATAANVQLRFLKADGTTASHYVRVPVLARRTVVCKDVPGMSTAEFSTVVETDAEIVADRTMQWNADGYGSHSETAVRAPATTWYLAEGATHSGFRLFYLLQNPATSATTVSITYLRPAPLPAIVKSYTVAALGRTTLDVSLQDAGLTSTDVSAVITASAPIIVERAMYLDAAGRLFGAGHDSAGVTAPSTSWFFAEGATGAYFDLFLLLANPGANAATVTTQYLLPSGASLTRTYSVAASSRRTVWVDQEAAALADTAVSMIVIATAPIVAERAMWWPGPTAATWQEAHNSPGATTTGTRWAVAEGEQGGAGQVGTYYLVANTGSTAATVSVTIVFEDGTAPISRTFSVLGNSRFNIDVGAEFPAAAGRRFGAIIDSGAAPIVVERAMYSNANGVTWAAGTNALGTKLQ